MHRPTCTTRLSHPQLLTAALLQPACRGLASLDLSANALGPEAPLCLVPLLHEPPAAARRRASVDSLAANPPPAAGPPAAAAAAASGGPGAALLAGGQHALLSKLVLAGNPIGDAGAEVGL